MKERPTDTIIIPESPVPLAAAFGHERVQLMQIGAMLTCLYEVLLYADDQDSIMHADVSSKLLSDCVGRMETLISRLISERDSAVS